MSFVSYWEIFGIVLVTLYFVLSLLFPKTKDSQKEEKKHEDRDNRSASTSSLSEDLKKGTEKSLKTVEQRIASSEEDKSRNVVDSHNTDDESIPGPSQQEVNTELHKDKSTPLKLQDTVCSNGVNEVEVAFSSFEEASIEPLQASVIETPKLSELTDASLSFTKEPRESLQKKPDHDTHVVKSERQDNEMQKFDKYPSKYLHKESENGAEGLPLMGAISIDRISDSTTDKPGEESFSREIQATEVKILHHEEIKASNELENKSLAAEMTTSPIPQNNNNLEKFADGLATSTIETAVDNSVCFSNFAENLSEKIFWASADDVISEVHANIEKQKQESAINNEEELKPIKLESLSCTVASEVVNEAVGEAALREEYKSEDETEVSPQRIQPHFGYVVENVVNNAICEAALKLKKDEDEDIDITDVLETPADNEKSQSESGDIDVSENIAETIVHSDVYCNNEQFINSNVTNEYHHGSASKVISSITTDEKLDDSSQSTEDEPTINKEIKGYAIDTQSEQENLTEETQSSTDDQSSGISIVDYEETETQKEHPTEDERVVYTDDQISDWHHDENKHDQETEALNSQSAEDEEADTTNRESSSFDQEKQEHKEVEGVDFSNEQINRISIADHQDDEYKHEEIETLISQSAEDEGSDTTSCNRESSSFDQEQQEHKETKSSKRPSAEVEEVSIVDHDKNKHKETIVSESQSAEVEEVSIVGHDENKHKEAIVPESQSAEAKEVSIVGHDENKHKEAIVPESQSAEVEEVAEHDRDKHEKAEASQSQSKVSTVDRDEKKYQETETSQSHFADIEGAVAEKDQSSELGAVHHDDDKHVETKVEVVDNNKQSDTELQSSDEAQEKQTNQEKDELKAEERKDFWRRSLILDLEEDFDLEESFSSDATSPGSPKPIHVPHERSDEYIDSEEDEVIDHDADAKLGAVGGSNTTGQTFNEEDFDFYDYGSSDDDIIVEKNIGEDDVGINNDANNDGDDEDDEEELFEPVLTVDGLCISKQTRKGTKKRENLKSVGSRYNRAIVLDNGCGYIKLGYAGDRIPRVTEQTVSGIPSRFSMQITGMGTNLRDFKKFGSEAVSKAGVMHLSHPMKAGIIDNWTDVEDVWEFMIYNQLGAEVGDNPIIMTEISQNPKKNREKITEILFEHLNVPAMYLADQLPLSIYASGLTSGLCLSSGYSCSQAAVVYEGHTLTYTQQHLDIGGGHLTENLKLLLRDNRGHNFTTSSGWQIVNDIKETVSYVPKDFSSEVKSYKTNDALTKFYTLPDGQVIDIGYECMSSVEPLFQPSELLTADATTASQSPVHEMVNKAIKRCDKDLQQMCHNHIILSGGTTLLKGFTSRLQHELHQINHSVRKIRTPDHRRYSAWIGGSILGSLPMFEDQYVTMDEYGDSGPRIVHKKCF